MTQSADISTPTSALPKAPQTLARLWPAWVILGLTGVAWVISVTPAINNLTRFIVMMVGPLAGAVLFAVWLLGLSRLSGRERLSVTLITLALGIAAWQISTKDMGVTVWIYGVPLALAAIAIGETLWRNRSVRPRIGLVTALLAVAWGWLPFVRNDGFRGDYLPELAWRWTPTKESTLAPATLAAASSAPSDGTELAAASWTVADTDWPLFRGAQLQGRAVGITQLLNWEEHPPSVLWKQPIGPGWSSFISVAGKLFTQEQRGEQELVSCYDAATGTPVWQSTHATRFSDVVSGAGPRSTPTFDRGQLFTFGAKGLLTSLDASTGRVIWQRDLMQEVGAQLPVWGFSGSTLVIEEAVIIYAGGTGDNGLMAVDRHTGKTMWAIASKGMNFSSAQPLTFAQTTMMVFGDEEGLFAADPATGKVLWKFLPSEWKGPAVCQPQQIDAESLIVTLGDGIGVARLNVKSEGEQWLVKELWTSNQLKPSFNDMVYHQGHLYGFDQNILVCLDAETGLRKWKKGRYGFGQLVLLPEVDQLIVLSEQGECVLVAADPTAHRELGRFPAIEGKTWNHPIIAGKTLFVRNGEEAAAIKLE